MPRVRPPDHEGVSLVLLVQVAGESLGRLLLRSLALGAIVGSRVPQVSGRTWARQIQGWARSSVRLPGFWECRAGVV